MFFSKKSSKQDLSLTARRKRRLNDAQESIFNFQANELLSLFIFIAFSLLTVCICFIGQSPAGPQIFPNQLAKFRVVADFSFSYTSDIKTKRLQEQKRQMVAPVYSIHMDAFESFSQSLHILNEKLEETSKDTLTQEITINNLIHTLSTRHNISLDKEDIITLLSLDSSTREQIFREGLYALKQIFNRGIYNASHFSFSPQKSTSFLNITIDDDQQQPHYQTEESALRFLRLNLSVLDTNTKVTQLLFRIFKNALQPNLLYDPQKTKEAIDIAIKNINPIEVFVERGQVIITPNTIINNEDYEQLVAYKRFLKSKEKETLGINIFLFQKIFITLIIIFTTVFYIKVALPNFKSSKRYRILPALLILINLGFVRLIVELTESNFISDNPLLVTLLPFLLPLAFAPILTTLLIGPAPAVLVAILISAFSTLIQGTHLAFFFICILSSLVSIYFSKNTRRHSKVLLAGVLAGAILGLGIITLNFLETSSIHYISTQLLCSLLSGVISAIMANGCRSFLENAFGITTCFTLLELTDYNHPLLRRLQVEAPGTYHHSLMVANLAERAALEIDANSLLCRASSLFHDIGKLVKPDYFIENQRAGNNPHDSINPSISAIIIKSHVKEGIELAREFRLPKPIMDAIKEHHGTTLITFFYNKALKQIQDNPQSEKIVVDPNTFRYEGPKPSSKETAIVFFADCVEAASRSLKKYNHQSISELVNNLFENRLSENQLDQSPLTMSDIYKIKNSFIFTLTNMLHARIEYPNAHPSSPNKNDESSSYA